MKTFAFRLAETGAAKPQALMVRDGVAVAGCTAVGTPAHYFSDRAWPGGPPSGRDGGFEC